MSFKNAEQISSARLILDCVRSEQRCDNSRAAHQSPHWGLGPGILAMLRGKRPEPNMTTKKLEKLAKQHGWIKQRNGAKHMIYLHETHDKRITIPYSVRETVGMNIAKQLAI